MKRYSMPDNYDPAMGYGPAAMAEDDAGEWVRHDDMFVFTINEQEQTIGMRGEAYRLLADMAYQYAVDCGMANYLETRIEIRGASGEPAQQWVMTMQRCEGRTPHELREDAEQKLKWLQQQLDKWVNARGAIRAQLVFDDWRQDGNPDSIYQTALGTELSSGDMHSGTVFTATVEFDDVHIADDIRAAWAQSKAYPVFRVMPEADE